MSLVKKRPEYAVYKLCKVLDQSVAGLDPLELNEFFAEQFPAMSERGCVKEMATLVTNHLRKFGLQKISGFGVVEAMATTRDLGMIASSLTRWGILLQDVPLLEYLLKDLSERTHEVPSDTVFSYGPRNPTGLVRRRFTTTDEELTFIHSFTEGMGDLYTCLAALEILGDSDVVDPRYQLITTEARQAFTKMADAISTVHKSITPAFFTTKLRPFLNQK